VALARAATTLRPTAQRTRLVAFGRRRSGAHESPVSSRVLRGP
jgi:hypothetical protein